MAGAGRPSLNPDLYFLLYGFRVLGHPNLKDAILEGRFHLVLLHLRGIEPLLFVYGLLPLIGAERRPSFPDCLFWQSLLL